MVNPEDIETVTVLKDAAGYHLWCLCCRWCNFCLLPNVRKGRNFSKLNYTITLPSVTAMNLPEQAPLMEYLQAYSDAAGDQFWTMGFA